VLAITSGVNTVSEAWSSRALIAAPLPMMVGQVVAALAAYHWPDRRGAVAAGLLAAGCLVSAISGFFDGAFGNAELPRR
jgi:hypothetical protein